MKKKYIFPLFFIWILCWLNLALVSATIQYYYLDASVSGNVTNSYLELQNGTTGVPSYNSNNTSANITISYIGGTHDHVLNISDVSSYDLYIKLQIVSVTNLSNLNLTKISFKNSTGSLEEQLIVENKSVTQNEGSYVQINDSEKFPLIVEEDSFNSSISTQIEMNLICKRLDNDILYYYRIILFME